MSNRTLLEINHDWSPGLHRKPGQSEDDALLEWARAIQRYTGGADVRELPRGVTFKHIRHHSEPDPMEGREGKPWFGG